MSGSKASYQRARRAAIKAGMWNPRGGGVNRQKGGMYEEAKIHDVTTLYKIEYIPDENGRFRDAEGKTYRREETLPESKAFREIMKLPIGSQVVIHVPAQNYIQDGYGYIPAHNERYEVRERTATIKRLVFMETGNKRGFSILPTGNGFNSRPSESGFDIKKASDIQDNLRLADKFTLYARKNEYRIPTIKEINARRLKRKQELSSKKTLTEAEWQELMTGNYNI